MIRNVYDDLEVRADDLDAIAYGWRRLEIGFWILAILGIAGMVVCISIDAIPQWVSIVAGMIVGYVLGRATTARRRRRKATQESARLRGLIDGKRRTN